MKKKNLVEEALKASDKAAADGANGPDTYDKVQLAVNSAKQHNANAELKNEEL